MKTIKIKNNYLRRIFGSKENILFIWIFLIIVAKIIRYTVLKTSLVDTGVGHRMILSILNHNTVFELFENGESADATGNTAFLFDKTNFLGFSTYEQFEVAITLLWNLILVFMMKKCVKYYDTLQTLFIIVSILALNIFDFTLAKEPIQFLYFLVIFYILESRKLSINQKWLWCVMVILASILTFRVYYVLLFGWAIGAALLYSFSYDKKMTLKKLLLLFLLVFVVYVAVMLVIQKLSPASYAELIRVRTRTSTATTDIRTIFGANNIFLFGLNYLLVVVRLLFPVELLRLGFKFIVYVLVQLVLTSVFFKALFDIKKLTPSVRIALFLFIGFVLMSAFFEPDFGSWIRHEIAAFPILLIISGMTQISYSQKSFERKLRKIKW